MRHSLQRLLEPAGYEVDAVKSGSEALKRVGETAFDVALMDIQMSGVGGLDTLRRLRGADPKLPVVLITAYGTAELAIQAMQVGAYDYVLKPFDVATLKGIVDRAAEVGRLSRTRVTIDPPPVVDPSEDRIVGINPGMQEVYKRIGQVAATDVPILVRGETGTGKELVARAVYQHSRRANLPFMAINCAAIPEGLLESEMFGHKRGAFTNAFTRRIGKFEQANRGTLFLDEIGDMAVATQAKILRVLQDGTFQRLGGDVEVKVDVRVIAATHRDLEADVQAGRFREDLYYRLNVVSVVLPPLRERKDDLPRLIDYFVGRFCAELKVERVSISSEAMERLIGHDWPGNIRELQNCLKNAILTCRGGITVEDVRLPSPSGDPPGSGTDSSRRGRAGEASLSEPSPAPSREGLSCPV
ncbi:MAG: sigma-54-dependent Fis family transcriptional regulator [Candidatus Latescibacteria bacterium]|nr:sigma-54-dependent Fis family transcriptional regulator [Candidatus Latescibacterota bacterium]